jgi:hypothetical protein
MQGLNTAHLLAMFHHFLKSMNLNAGLALISSSLLAFLILREASTSSECYVAGVLEPFTPPPLSLNFSSS